ncbi:MAG: T9SS type A sorting domain-containing protein [Saprospiraceae bacterium]|nr:T9SS type A sorting domain-containing protein [Saprospiraceae bacterium]
MGIDRDKFYFTSLSDALSAADATLLASPGSRPVLYVEELASGDKFIAPEVTATENLSIQAAINYSDTGTVIHILPGTMVEGAQIVIDRDITMIGAGKKTSTIQPGFNTGSSGDSRGWILVNDGVEFNLSHLTMNGSGNLVYQGIRHRGFGVIDSVQFTEIKYNESGPNYAGLAVVAFGGNVDIYNSMFSEIGRVGVLYFGSGITGSTFENNMYTGKGDGDFLDYMLDISAGAIVDVKSSTVSDNRGVASSDGSTSAGILVTTFFGPGTEARITGSTITDNTVGIAVGYNNTDQSLVEANNNDIYGNTDFGVSSTNPVVDATLNWWGDPSGPSGEGYGTGDAITDNVLFCPWLDASITAGGSPVLGQGDVSLSCNDRVHVSLNENCQALLEADMLLEGEPFDNDDFEIDVWKPNGESIPNAILNGTHIGMILTYRVTHSCSKTSCWGTLIVEDKLIPDLQCRDTMTITGCEDGTEPEVVGFPLDTPFIATRIPGQNEFIVTGADPCGEVRLRYSDEITKNGCDAEFYTEIKRTWVVEDASGNTTSCMEQIGVQPGDFMNVTFPPDFNGFDKFVLECDNRDRVVKTQPIGGINIGWNSLKNGLPSPYDKVLNASDTLIGTGAPEGISCDHIAVTYKDRVIETCGPNTYKLFREWRVYDWCSGEDSVHLQSIKVVDTKAPVVICPNITPVIVPTSPWSCTGSYVLPDPIFDPNYAGGAEVPVILQECSGYTYEIQHKIASVGTSDPDECADVDESQTFFTTNVRRLPNGQFEVFDMPQGCNWIKYVITDSCGNTTICGLELFVKDSENPVAVCDEHTVLSLNENGHGQLCAEVVDNGSQDNCTSRDSLIFEIKRMSEHDSLFRDCIAFNCLDVDISPVMVVFRVYDQAGNYNDCMVEVSVQDKIAPVIECPPAITLHCTEDYTDDSVTGIPQVDDQCGSPKLRSRIVVENINDCGIGFVIKRWRVEDNGGLFAVCDQRIDLIDDTPFDSTNIIWPADYTVDGCDEVDAHPNNLPTPYGWPRYENDDCAQPVAGYEDDIHYSSNLYCIKIIRTWEVIDWCQYDINTGRGGRWTYVQTIYLENDVAPQIVNSTCEDITVCAEGNCEGLVEFELAATDDCTPSDELVWSYEIREIPSRRVIENGLGNTYSRRLPGGQYRFTFTVKDACGNETECSSDVTIRDCKEPTPYCKPGIITTIMPTTGYVDIWASDFNDGSFDNCTDTVDLRYSFSSDVDDRSRRVTCDSLNGQVADTFEYEMWVTDLDGNQDFCRVTIIVQDNQDVCNNSPAPTVAVGGEIYTEERDMIESVKVDLMHRKVYSRDMNTKGDGKYAFHDLIKDDEYAIVPQRNDDHLNGISTADLVLIQRYLLGKSELDSPYKIIAADANGTSSVSASDIAALRKLILGIYSELPNVNSWRFIDAQHTFTDPGDPWLDPFYETISYSNLDSDKMNTDFVGIKVGDVNGDVVANGHDNNQTRNQATLTLVAEEQVVAPGELTGIQVRPSQSVLLQGYQMTLELIDAEFVSLTSEVIDISTGNYHFNETDGILTVSWNANEVVNVNNKEALFTLTIEPRKAAMSSEMVFLSSSVTRAEAYIEDLEVVDLELRFEDEVAESGAGMKLYQNIPNPFSTSTVIPFELPRADDAKLTVFDVTGKVQLKVHIEGKKGYNEFQLNVDRLSQGVLYYQLESNKEIATRRMLLLNK